jgi:hypothetical protein
MTDHSPNPNATTAHDDALLSYLDDELTPPQRADFESKLESDPALRARLAALHAIDDSLTRIAAEPAPITHAPQPRRAWIPIAVAAALLLAASAALLTLTRPAPTTFTPKATLPPNTFDAAQDYQALTIALEPHVVCDTPEKFLAYTQDLFDEPITADFTTHTTLVGWRAHRAPYTTPEPGTAPPLQIRVLLARAPSADPVLAFFIPEGLDAPALPESSALHHFTRDLGSVRVHEITPLDHPTVLPALSLQ